MGEVTRYFVGYPRPRVSLGPFVTVGLAAILAHPGTAAMAAAALRPIKKVEHDAGISIIQVIALPPSYEQSSKIGCGGPPIPSRWRTYTQVVSTTFRAPAPLHWREDGFLPGRSVLEGMKKKGATVLYASFNVCTDPEGHITSFSLSEGTGDRRFDDWVARKIRSRWDAQANVRMGPARGGCYVVAYVLKYS